VEAQAGCRTQPNDKMRDYTLETKNRVEFIQNTLSAAHAEGIVFGNSGGKDCLLVGILCKKACENTLGLILPCGSKQNYESDKADAEIFAKQFNIATRIIDLADVKEKFVQTASETTKLSDFALVNIAPRLRMTTLYAVAASENRLVAGTGNRSERYMGYFTKWGDGAFDFNPIADLTVTEIYEFLRFLNASDCIISSIISKAPSAGLFDGQTDEKDMGVTYHSIDNFLLSGSVNELDGAIIQRFHQMSEHKRKPPLVYGER
jgi:NAD+ synthase